MRTWGERVRRAWRYRFSPRARDLVLGCAAGYEPQDVRPFVESLLTIGAFIGDIALFVRPDDRALIAYLRERGVIIVPFDESQYPISNVYMVRYFAYADYLRARTAAGRRHRYILLSDIRDVTFQAPLFSTPCLPLELVYETPTTTIGTEPWNSDWIRREFGVDVLTALTGKRVTCSGTVCGEMAGILSYLDAMQAVMLGLPDEIKNGLRGDQAVHNYAFHTGRLPDASIIENFRRVATLHFVDGDSLHVDSAGRIPNPDGSISEIAHQWDRHPHLLAAIEARYG